MNWETSDARYNKVHKTNSQGSVGGVDMPYAELIWLEAWHINFAHAPLNCDDVYLHLGSHCRRVS